MILSYHPCFEADMNVICAGREPQHNDLQAIKQADAVILPQGCRESLYQMARANCGHVFPNYDARFTYKEKIGQIHLFKKTGILYPHTNTYPDIDSFYKIHGNPPAETGLIFPCIFKFNWGGEGSTVFYVKSLSTFMDVLKKAAGFEKTGQYGFLIQEYIPANNRTLRVVVINKKIITYWRINENPDNVIVTLSKGAHIDKSTDPELQESASVETKKFCKKTGLNLAGIDFIFSPELKPLILEINYFFGRRGLGGSESYYQILCMEIYNWLNNIGLSFEQKR